MSYIFTSLFGERNNECFRLHSEIKKGSISGVEYLISKGVDINCRLHGSTPLDSALKYNESEICKVLIRSGGISSK